MKFVFAPDSFKGSLSAWECACLLEESAKRCFPEAECVLLPIADGGEGTAEALGRACGGKFESIRVRGPLGEETEAKYAWLPEQRAVVEMAEASGLPLCRGKLDTLKASSFGTGQLIRHVLDQGAKEILIGIGGSATNDGGMGMLQALGVRFYDENNEELSGCGEALEKVERADWSELHPRLSQTPIQVICDVTNPLLGEKGATAVYGPQKGVTQELFPRLEQGMQRYAGVLSRELGRDIASFPGAGAAGGVGAALGGVLNAGMGRGVDAVLDAVGFEKHLEHCDLVITGEGRIDGQSVCFGKAVAGIAKRCGQRRIPLGVMVGSMAEGAEDLYQLADAAIFPIVSGPMTLSEAMKNAAELYAQTADRWFRTLKIGFFMNKL